MSRTNKPRWSRTALPAAVIFLAAVGCRRFDYTASSLPSELVVSPVVSMQSFDVSRSGKPQAPLHLLIPGDTVELSVLTGAKEDPAAPWTLRVADNGALDIPLIGPVAVAGLDLAAAEYRIAQASMERQIHRNPTVSLQIKQRRKKQVFVAGAVNNPGSYELDAANCDLASAVLAAGGLRDDAGRVVELRQPTQAAMHAGSTGRYRSDGDGSEIDLASYNGTAGGTAVTHIDLKSLEFKPGDGVPLIDGALVTVQEQPARQVHVMGVIRNATLEIPPDRNLRLLDALAQAGGPEYSLWISDKVNVIRQDADGEDSVVIRASIRKAKRDQDANILLADGDVVSVEETAMTFTLSTINQIIGMGARAAAGSVSLAR